MPKKLDMTDLIYLLDANMYKSILDQAAAGDPDWIFDIIQELDYMEPNAMFYIKDFHGVLLQHWKLNKLRRALTSKDFDTDKIFKQLPKFDQKTHDH